MRMFSWGRQNDLKKGLVVSFGSVSPKALIAVAGLLKELCSTLYTSFGAPFMYAGHSVEVVQSNPKPSRNRTGPTVQYSRHTAHDLMKDQTTIDECFI